MSKVDKAFIDDIFGIPRDGSNIADDDNGESYNGKGGKGNATVIPFEEKVTEVAAEIAKAAAGTLPVEAAVAQEKAPEKSQTKKESVAVPLKKENVANVAKAAIPADPQATTSMFGDIFGDVEATKVEKKVERKNEPKKDEDDGSAVQPILAPVAPKNPPTLAVAKEEPKVETKATTNVPVKTVEEDLGIKAQTQPSPSSAPIIIAGKALKHPWVTTPPSPKYQRFYEAKRDALVGSLLKGGELPFDQYYSELENANVDVTVGEQFNAELVCTKMSECQKHRERIKQIQLRVNRQFFQWERHMDLFEGLLSRIEYERGKQEGVKYEHMYDMESYFGELKSLHKSIDNVMRVLDAAFECLSRQVTITMPIKESERYTTSPKPMTPTLSRYDGLKTQANNGSPLTSVKPKEAGTPAEPNPTKSAWDL